ncbi:MAG: energy-coupled thiamine transporter ThiT [Negativicutes bacterium]|nr:energy-coupled thiamine transporter ThiT [Negativicutes bacterium]
MGGSRKISTRQLVLSGFFLALAVVLKMIRLFSLPQGGSVTAGSVLPLMLLARTYGWRWGGLCGALFGLIDFAIAPYFFHPLQFLLDYPISYAILALVAVIPPLWLAAAVAVAARLACNVLSGIVFFASFAPPGMPAWQYSLVYNASTVGLDGLIAVIIILLLPTARLTAMFRRTG